MGLTDTRKRAEDFTPLFIKQVHKIVNQVRRACGVPAGDSRWIARRWAKGQRR